jgi:hypothetical protein
MIEKWKEIRDNGGYAAAVLMDLSKAFDTINYKLLIAKLRAYGFDLPSLEIIFDYFTNRQQRTKINSSLSTLSLVLCGAAQGSILGPKIFNINLNDLFFEFVDTDVCNIADDTTPFACDTDIAKLLQNLESDVASAIDWFAANFMILNQEKCHFLISGPETSVQQMHVAVGEEVIWESSQEKLLGVLLDKLLKFHEHVIDICRKASSKLSALTRFARVMSFVKKRNLMNAFVQAQFSFCPLLWMFCSRSLHKKINSIHKRALQNVYLDYTSTFEELLKKDNSVTIHHRTIQLLAIEMFKVVNKCGPELIRDLFKLDDKNRTRSNRAFFRPNVNTEHYGKESIRYFGPIVWDDMLPDKYKSIKKLKKFKEEIKKWTPTNCPCFLCKEFVGGVGYVTTYE